MKESKYNLLSSVEEDGTKKIILLNGITGRMLVLFPEEYNFLKTVMNDPDKQKAYPLLTEKLQAGHFLIEDEEIELNILRERNYKAVHSKGYSLTVNPTLNCNFHCWYCYESHRPGRMSDEIMQRIKLFAFKKLQSDDVKTFSLGWFGGEPLLYFKKIVYPLSLAIKEEADRIGVRFTNSMTTNGFLLTPDIAKMCVEIGLNYFQITLDGDKETHDKVRNHNGMPSFKQIISNCISLLNISEKAFITLRINYTTDSIIQKDYSKILESIPHEKRCRVRIQFQRVWQTYSTEGNDDKVKISLAENQKTLEKAGFVNSKNTTFALYKGYVCYADRMEYANINYDGYVYKCTAQDYKIENALGYLNEKGDIIWHENYLKRNQKKADFDNPMCLKCNYLPLCGGPCFAKRQYMEKIGADSCPIKNTDTDIDTFIRESYYAICQKRSQHVS